MALCTGRLSVPDYMIVAVADWAGKLAPDDNLNQPIPIPPGTTYANTCFCSAGIDPAQKDKLQEHSKNCEKIMAGGIPDKAVAAACADNGGLLAYNEEAVLGLVFSILDDRFSEMLSGSTSLS